MSTLKDIAKHCQVSYSTVSRAFDPESRVSPTTRKRILEYAEEIKYRPNLIARSLKKHESKTVGIIIPSIDNIFFIEVLKYIEIALKHCGYRLLVSFVQKDVNTELDCLELMSASQVDGMIIVPEDCSNREYILRLSKHIHISQLFEAPYSEIDSVVMDDIGGTANGTRYLINRGHRKILYVGEPKRLPGFTNTLREYGISDEEVLIMTDCQNSRQVVSAIKEFQPTAIFAIACASEYAWNAIKALNLSIPQDVSLIVYDDTKWVSMLGVTAIAHNLEEIANTSVDQLIFRLRNKNTPQKDVKHIVLDPFIRERNSVKWLAP